jgi:hypothetical protein
MDQADIRRIRAAYIAYLMNWREGKVEFKSPAQWMAEWAGMDSYRSLYDRVCASMGYIEA